MLCGSALSLFPAAALHSSRAGCLLSSLHNLSAPAAWANSSAALLAGLISLCNYTCTAFLLPLPPPLRFMNGIAQPSSAETQLKEVQEKEKNFLVKKKPLETMWYYPAYMMMEQEKQQGESRSACSFQSEEKLRNEPAQSPCQAQRLLH